MNVTSARVIITMRCNRRCGYCCNKYPHIARSMKKIKSLDFLTPMRYKEIIISGGEPMLYPSLVEKTAKHARLVGDVGVKVYLYTAIYTPEIIRIASFVDGIHYTLHKNASHNDIIGVRKFQLDMQPHKDRLSIRLSLDRTVPPFRVDPSVFNEIRVKHWRTEEEAVVPENEHLYLLQGGQS